MGPLMVPFFLKKGPLKSPLGDPEGSPRKVHTLTVNQLLHHSRTIFSLVENAEYSLFTGYLGGIVKIQS